MRYKRFYHTDSLTEPGTMCYAIKYFFSSKNNECLGVNILPQISGNSVSELPNLKIFLWGHMPPYPPRGKGAFGPF